MTEPKNETITLGIDLGTTYSLCSVMQDGKPVLLPNAMGEFLTPSAVSADSDGKLLVGAAARARAASAPERTALFFKRDMGTDRVFDLGEHRFRPEQLSAAVLAELKRDAEAATGCRVTEAVVTVPAYFGERQRAATRMAGQIAGLKVDRIVNEPTAAALAYGLHARDREVRAVVLDMGGGTFDVTLLEIIEGVVEVQASAGDSRLGGEDFVDALLESRMAWLAERGWSVADLPQSRARLREALEQAKRTLTTSETATVALPALRTTAGERDVQFEVSRADAETTWAPLLQRLRMPIARALRDGDARPEDIDEVLVVGGATRMPCFVQLAAQMFGRMPSRHLPPDEAVALGAAVQAALKAGDAAVSDMVVTDVAPFTLGISTASEMGTRLVQGVFSPVLERGTVIPASREESFHTLQDNQRQLLVEVYQGEHSLCSHNQKLGEFLLKRLPRKPAGECVVHVRFTYDLNGILEVDMRVDGTDRQETLLIEQRPGQMTPGQVTAARDAMQRIKFHPRDSLPNRTALERADALFVELTGPARAELGQSIAVLRGAIEVQDPSMIDDARGQLLALMDALRRQDG